VQFEPDWCEEADAIARHLRDGGVRVEHGYEPPPTWLGERNDAT
jgi:hypothetical protein